MPGRVVPSSLLLRGTASRCTELSGPCCPGILGVLSGVPGAISQSSVVLHVITKERVCACGWKDPDRLPGDGRSPVTPTGRTSHVSSCRGIRSSPNPFAELSYFILFKHMHSWMKTGGAQKWPRFCEDQFCILPRGVTLCSALRRSLCCGSHIPRLPFLINRRPLPSV